MVATSDCTPPEGGRWSVVVVLTDLVDPPAAGSAMWSLPLTAGFRSMWHQSALWAAISSWSLAYRPKTAFLRCCSEQMFYHKKCYTPFLVTRLPKFLHPFLPCQLSLPCTKYWSCAYMELFPSNYVKLCLFFLAYAHTFQ